jgi:hypothetical protein
LPSKHRRLTAFELSQVDFLLAGKPAFGLTLDIGTAMPPETPICPSFWTVGIASAHACHDAQGRRLSPGHLARRDRLDRLVCPPLMQARAWAGNKLSPPADHVSAFRPFFPEEIAKNAANRRKNTCNAQQSVGILLVVTFGRSAVR